MEQEECKKLQEEIKDIYENQMTDEQFEKFALSWIGTDTMADFLSSIIETETDVDLLKEWLKDAKTYLNSGTIEETTGEKQLVLDFHEDEWLDVENQMVAVVKEKLGDDYEVDNYHLETKIVVSAKNTKIKGDV